MSDFLPRLKRLLVEAEALDLLEIFADCVGRDIVDRLRLDRARAEVVRAVEDLRFGAWGYVYRPSAQARSATEAPDGRWRRTATFTWPATAPGALSARWVVPSIPVASQNARYSRRDSRQRERSCRRGSQARSEASCRVPSEQPRYSPVYTRLRDGDEKQQHDEGAQQQSGDLRPLALPFANDLVLRLTTAATGRRRALRKVRKDRRPNKRTVAFRQSMPVGSDTRLACDPPGKYEEHEAQNRRANAVDQTRKPEGPGRDRGAAIGSV